VSRLHAFIKYENGKFTLKDNTSKFGTLVMLTKPLKVHPEKVAIQVGRTVISFSLKAHGESRKEKLNCGGVIKKEGNPHLIMNQDQYLHYQRKGGLDKEELDQRALLQMQQCFPSAPGPGVFPPGLNNIKPSGLGYPVAGDYQRYAQYGAHQNYQTPPLQPSHPNHQYNNNQGGPPYQQPNQVTPPPPPGQKMNYPGGMIPNGNGMNQMYNVDAMFNVRNRNENMFMNGQVYQGGPYYQ
jgi:hypothetical protein